MNIYTWNTLKSINVYIHDIEYDLEGINGYKNYDKSVTNGLTKEQQLAELPECLTFRFKCLVDRESIPGQFWSIWDHCLVIWVVKNHPRILIVFQTICFYTCLYVFIHYLYILVFMFLYTIYIYIYWFLCLFICCI